MEEARRSEAEAQRRTALEAEPARHDERSLPAEPHRPPTSDDVQPPAGLLGPQESLVALVEERLDELCGQLDDAFDEMAGRIDRVELRVAAVRQNLDEVLAATRDAGAAAIRAGEAVEALAGEPRTPDLSPLLNQLGQVAQALRTEVADTRSTVEGSVARLAGQVAELRAQPVEVDTRELEEAASRSALHNAADIASLRHHVDSVAEAVRHQEKWLGEMRSTLDWIKERLLLR